MSVRPNTLLLCQASAIFELTKNMPSGHRPFASIVTGAVALNRFDDAERYLSLMRSVNAPQTANLTRLLSRARRKIDYYKRRDDLREEVLAKGNEEYDDINTENKNSRPS